MLNLISRKLNIRTLTPYYMPYVKCCEARNIPNSCHSVLSDMIY